MIREYCTLFDKNYATKGLALYHSLVQHGGEFILYILALDDETYGLFNELNLPNVFVVPLAIVESRIGLGHVRPTRNWMEYCWTLASQFMEYLMLTEKPSMLTYLDSDLFFYSSPEPIFDELGTASIAIIPHRFSPGLKRLEVNGIYNVGWLTIRNDIVGIECLTLWAAQCRVWCFHRNEDGKFGDQGYLDSWPERYGTSCKVINHIGAGAAPWNVMQYDVGRNINGNTWIVLRLDPHRHIALQYALSYNLIFYHFHEFTHDDEGHVIRLTRHQLSGDHKQYIYDPYIRAILDAAHLVKSGMIARKQAQQKLKQQGDSV